MIDKKKLIEELLDCVADATDTETQMGYDTVLPAVFTVNSLSGNLTHLATEDKMPLCGVKLFQPKRTETEIKKVDGELKEHWKSELQGDNWVIVSEYNYCKRCLSVLNGR